MATPLKFLLCEPLTRHDVVVIPADFPITVVASHRNPPLKVRGAGAAGAVSSVALGRLYHPLKTHKGNAVRTNRVHELALL